MRTKLVFHAWLAFLLLLILGFKASEVKALFAGRLESSHEIMFLALLVLAFLAIGIAGELFLEHNHPRRPLLLLTLYGFALSVAAYSAMAHNRTPIEARYQQASAQAVFDRIHKWVPTRAEDIRLAALEQWKRRVEELKEVLAYQKPVESLDAVSSVPDASRIQSLRRERDRLNRVVTRARGLATRYVVRPRSAREMMQSVRRSLDEIAWLERQMGWRIGGPEILAELHPSLLQLYVWSFQNPAERAVGPLWKSLLLSFWLSLFSFAIGGVCHDLHQLRSEKVIPINQIRAKAKGAAA
jgi:hypothetical protein